MRGYDILDSIAEQSGLEFCYFGRLRPGVISRFGMMSGDFELGAVFVDYEFSKASCLEFYTKLEDFPLWKRAVGGKDSFEDVLAEQDLLASIYQACTDSPLFGRYPEPTVPVLLARDDELGNHLGPHYLTDYACMRTLLDHAEDNSAVLFFAKDSRFVFTFPFATSYSSVYHDVRPLSAEPMPQQLVRSDLRISMDADRAGAEGTLRLLDIVNGHLPDVAEYEGHRKRFIAENKEKLVYSRG